MLCLTEFHRNLCQWNEESVFCNVAGQFKNSCKYLWYKIKPYNCTCYVAMATCCRPSIYSKLPWSDYTNRVNAICKTFKKLPYNLKKKLTVMLARSLWWMWIVDNTDKIHAIWRKNVRKVLNISSQGITFIFHLWSMTLAFRIHCTIESLNSELKLQNNLAGNEHWELLLILTQYLVKTFIRNCTLKFLCTKK